MSQHFPRKLPTGIKGAGSQIRSSAYPIANQGASAATIAITISKTVLVTPGRQIAPFPIECVPRQTIASSFNTLEPPQTVGPPDQKYDQPKYRKENDGSPIQNGTPLRGHSSV